MVRELSIATMQSKRFFEGMNLQTQSAEIEKQMTNRCHVGTPSTGEGQQSAAG